MERNEEFESALGAEQEPGIRKVEKALEGALWPLGRDELVAIARDNDATRSVISLLSGLPARQFCSRAEVLGQISQRSSSASAGDRG
ncbi:MAG: DUF2795 domain-containing protein [Myxococcaceae bacterium]